MNNSYLIKETCFESKIAIYQLRSIQVFKQLIELQHVQFVVQETFFRCHGYVGILSQALFLMVFFL